MQSPRAKMILLVVAAGLGVARAAGAAELQIDFGDDGSLTVRAVQLFALVTVLGLAPGIAVMVTCFPFLVTVFAILRQAIGLQQSPPNMLIVTLALFLTYFVMQPVFTEAWQTGVQPLIDGQTDVALAAEKTLAPFQAFMQARVDPDTLAALADIRPPGNGAGDPPALDLLMPAFLLSEVARAFQVGFLIFLPFLVIDLVVAAVLMSMGMMMVPPAVVSLPFKLAFFVVVDGWAMLSGALVRSYL